MGTPAGPLVRSLVASVDATMAVAAGCARRKRNLRGLGAGRTERSGGATTLLIALEHFTIRLTISGVG